MTLTPFTIYMIMQADTIISACQTVAIIGLAASGLAAMLLPILCEVVQENREILKSFPKKTIAAVFMVCALGYILIPSTKTLAAMIVVPAIANSQAVQKDFPELYDLAVNKLKEQLAPSKEVEKK